MPISQPNVRSTILRRGNTAKPFVDGERLTPPTSSLGPVIANPLLKRLSGVAAVYQELSKLRVRSCNSREDLLSPVPLQTIGGSHDYSRQQTPRNDHKMWFMSVLFFFLA